MSEKINFNFEKPRTIEELEKAYHTHIGDPYPDTGESEEMKREWIEELLKMTKEDAKAAVDYREMQENQRLEQFQE